MNYGLTHDFIVCSDSNGNESTRHDVSSKHSEMLMCDVLLRPKMVR